MKSATAALAGERANTRRDAWTQAERTRLAIFLDRPLTRHAARVFFPNRSFVAVRDQVSAARKAAGVVKLPPEQKNGQINERASFWNGIAARRAGHGQRRS